MVSPVIESHSYLGGVCLGLVPKSVDLALDLGDALFCFENLAIDSIQITHQFLSSSFRVTFHGRISRCI